MLKVGKKKIQILEIGQQRLINGFLKSGFSLLEIIVFISIALIIAFSLTFSFDILKNSKNLSNINKKISLIENEIYFAKQYSLSNRSILSFNLLNNFYSNDLSKLDKRSFKNCYTKNKEKLTFFIYPSGITTSLNIECEIGEKTYEIFINKNGKPEIND